MADSHSPKIPSWLLEKAPSTPPSKGGRIGFLQKTLAGICSVFENEFYADKYAGTAGFLQIVDARVKLLTLLFFMLFCAFTKSSVILVFLILIATLYAKLSALPLITYLRRIWLYIPLLVFICSLPAATNLFTKGSPLFTLIPAGTLLFLPDGLYFTKTGLLMILRMFLRTGCSLSFGYLLLITTKWPAFIKAIRSLHLPRTFVSVIGMAYRYIFVLSETAVNIMQARFLRTVGKLTNRDNRRFFGHEIAFLFIKSSYLSDEIYDAMCCRGFTGDLFDLNTLKLKGADFIFIVNNIIIILILILGEHLF